MLVGFWDDEVEELQENVGELFGGQDVALLPATPALLASRVADLQQQLAAGAASSSEAATHAVAAAASPSELEQHGAAASLGRMMYFLDGPCKQLAARMNVSGRQCAAPPGDHPIPPFHPSCSPFHTCQRPQSHLVELGAPPAIVGAQMEHHAELTLQQALASLRTAHARYHRLHQPVQLQPQPLSAEDLAGARVTMNVVLDRGQVPASAGVEGRRGEAAWRVAWCLRRWLLVAGLQAMEIA